MKLLTLCLLLCVNSFSATLNLKSGENAKINASTETEVTCDMKTLSDYCDKDLSFNSCRGSFTNTRCVKKDMTNFGTCIKTDFGFSDGNYRLTCDCI